MQSHTQRVAVEASKRRIAPPRHQAPAPGNKSKAEKNANELPEWRNVNAKC